MTRTVCMCMQLSEKVLIKKSIFILTPSNPPRSFLSLPVLGLFSLPIHTCRDFYNFFMFSLSLFVGSILLNIAVIGSWLWLNLILLLFLKLFSIFLLLVAIWSSTGKSLSFVIRGTELDSWLFHLYIVVWGKYFSAHLNLSFFIYKMRIILTIIWL